MCRRRWLASRRAHRAESAGARARGARRTVRGRCARALPDVGARHGGRRGRDGRPGAPRHGRARRHARRISRLGGRAGLARRTRRERELCSPSSVYDPPGAPRPRPACRGASHMARRRAFRPPRGVAAVGPDASRSLPHPLDDATESARHMPASSSAVDRSSCSARRSTPSPSSITPSRSPRSAASAAWPGAAPCSSTASAGGGRSTTSTPVAVRFPTSKWRATSTTSSTSPELHSSAGRVGRGPLGAGTAHIFDARILVEVSVSLIEAAFGPDAA